MALRKTRAQDLDLDSLLGAIDAGQVALPNFQRDFDWTESDVKSLLGTVLNGWPAGSLLLLEGADEFYNPRPLEDAPNLIPTDDISYVVLDGQQRLTALYHAFYDRGPLTYALKIDFGRDYSDVDLLDDAIVSRKRVIRDRLTPSPADQWNARELPMHALRSATDFFDWRDLALRADQDIERAQMTRIYREFLAGVHNYKIPAVVIPASVPPAAVARIFERVNRTGMTLGAFDLVVARSFTQSFNLRQLWEEARREKPILQRYLVDDGLPILSVLGLRQRLNLRQAAVLDLPGSAIRDGWDDAVDHFVAALAFAGAHLGIVNRDWVPYRPMLTVLAALDYDKPLQTRGRDIERWFWATALGGRFDVASNTRAVSDYQRLSDGRDPITSSTFLVRETWLESTRKQQGALHRAFLASLATQVIAHQHLQGVVVREGLEWQASSLYDRVPYETDYDPPLHLRTLTFVIASTETGSWQVVDEKAQMINGADSELEFLGKRLDNLALFASEKIGDDVRVLTEAQFEELG